LRVAHVFSKLIVLEVAMTAPVLVPMNRAAATLRSRFTHGPLEQLYVVVEAGFFGGRQWARGEVVDAGDEGDGVAILAPRGHGRPRLGTVQGTRLFGDAGEPCLAARWAVLGRVKAIYRSVGADWVGEVVGGRMLEAA
jgi:hypothetical protein